MRPPLPPLLLRWESCATPHFYEARRARALRRSCRCVRMPNCETPREQSLR